MHKNHILKIQLPDGTKTAQGKMLGINDKTAILLVDENSNMVQTFLSGKIIEDFG